jgi:hypothetical protein
MYCPYRKKVNIKNPVPKHSLKQQVDAHKLFFENCHFLTKHKLEKAQHMTSRPKISLLKEASYNLKANSK